MPPTQIPAPPFAGVPPVDLTGFARTRWTSKHPPMDPDVTFAGKTVLVTGANAGLGFEAAVKYAQKGCSRLILAVRSVTKGEEAKKAILERSGRQQENDFITVLTVDLASFESVKTFIAALENEVQSTGLHIALLNAGLATQTFEKGPHGYEMALQVNVLSTALMAILLVPILHRTAKSPLRGLDAPHLTFVNSAAHMHVQRDWYKESLLHFTNDAKTFDIFKQYCAIKLLAMSIMLHVTNTIMATTNGEPDIIVNACCPDMCKTDLGRNFSLFYKGMMAVQQWIASRTAEEGARTLVGASVLGEEGMGGFWHCDVLYPLGDIARNEMEMERCWGDIKEILEKEGVISNIEGILRGKKV